MQVLWIDDDYQFANVMAERLRSVLPKVDLKTHITGSLSDAFDEVGRTKYDVVIMDCHLAPRSDPDTLTHATGLDLLRIMRERTPQAKFIAYSRFMDPLIDPDLRKKIAGADFLFNKPRSAHVLGVKLARVLRDFLPSDMPPRDKPEPSLILPARQSIITINTKLADKFRRNPELLRTIDPIRFEELVAELFEEDGYRVVLTPPRADGGKDLYVLKSDDKLQASFLVECKRYVPPNKVGVEVARQLYGLVQHESQSGGIIVTTSYFTRGAREFAATVPYQLFLRDFDDLQSWLQKPAMGAQYSK